MVVAAILLRAPTSPLSRTAAAISSREGAAVVEGGRPASSRDASMARRISARYSAVLSSTIPIRNTKKRVVFKNQNYLKNKVKT
jgi:hypothetical protein